MIHPTSNLTDPINRNQQVGTGAIGSAGDTGSTSNHAKQVNIW